MMFFRLFFAALLLSSCDSLDCNSNCSDEVKLRYSSGILFDETLDSPYYNGSKYVFTNDQKLLLLKNSDVVTFDLVSMAQLSLVGHPDNSLSFVKILKDPEIDKFILVDSAKNFFTFENGELINIGTNIDYPFYYDKDFLYFMNNGHLYKKSIDDFSTEMTIYNDSDFNGRIVDAAGNTSGVFLIYEGDTFGDFVDHGVIKIDSIGDISYLGGHLNAHLESPSIDSMYLKQIYNSKIYEITDASISEEMLKNYDVDEPLYLDVSGEGQLILEYQGYGILLLDINNNEQIASDGKFNSLTYLIKSKIYDDVLYILYPDEVVKFDIK